MPETNFELCMHIGKIFCFSILYIFRRLLFRFEMARIRHTDSWLPSGSQGMGLHEVVLSALHPQLAGFPGPAPPASRRPTSFVVSLETEMAIGAAVGSFMTQLVRTS